MVPWKQTGGGIHPRTGPQLEHTRAWKMQMSDVYMIGYTVLQLIARLQRMHERIIMNYFKITAGVSF